MKSIVVSMQNTLLTEAIMGALTATGDFRPSRILNDKVSDTPFLCRAVHADILLMEVARRSGFTQEERLVLAQKVRKEVPTCRVALICDENSDPDMAFSVKSAKQRGNIDAFFYGSVTAAYLTAALDAL